MFVSKKAGASVSIALLVALTAPQPVVASEDPDAWLPSVIDSASLHTAPLVTGTVTSIDGVPFPEGTPVEVVAYPSAEVVDAMEVGDSIDTTPVAKGSVGENGSFVIRLDPEISVARFSSDAGFVDFELRAVSGELYAPYSFSLPLSQLEDSSAADVTTTNAAVSSVDAVSLPANPRVASLAQSKESALHKTDVCGEYLVSNVGQRPVVVGTSYTSGSGVSGQVTYKRGSTSTLGVAVSISGKIGSFSKSGSTTRASTDTVGFAARSGGYAYRTFFTYGKYAQYCHPVYRSRQPSDTFAYKVHSNGFAGGSSVVAAATPSAKRCTSLGAKDSYVKDNTKAYNYGSGAKLDAVIGIDLSSRTGYSSTTSLRYTNSTSSSKALCGESGLPGGTPGRIVLR